MFYIYTTKTVPKLYSFFKKVGKNPIFQGFLTFTPFRGANESKDILLPFHLSRGHQS